MLTIFVFISVEYTCLYNLTGRRTKKQRKQSSLGIFNTVSQTNHILCTIGAIINLSSTFYQTKELLCPHH